MNAAYTKASGITTAKVGLARFMGPATLQNNPNQENHSSLKQYHVVKAIGSSDLTMDFLWHSGSTDINNASLKAYDVITHSGMTSTNKRVVPITDGIRPVVVPDATLEKY